MEKLKINTFQKVFLLIAAIGLIPIALSLGLKPQITFNYLFDISVSGVNQIHFLRSIMGLYLGLVVFWFVGAFSINLRQAAIYSLIVFMFGLATGRIISLLFDGIPHWLFLVYLLLEMGFGIIGCLLVKKPLSS